MASDISFIEFVVDQIKSAGEITYRKMFGEYTLYCDRKVVALICDNQLFVKPTEAGKLLLNPVIEAPPYPGAKFYFLIKDQVENSEWISNLIRSTAAELPEPKPKKKRSRGRKT